MSKTSQMTPQQEAEYALTYGGELDRMTLSPAAREIYDAMKAGEPAPVQPAALSPVPQAEVYLRHIRNATVTIAVIMTIGVVIGLIFRIAESIHIAHLLSGSGSVP